jgi:LPXTG-motif cell wall-anchored protein
MKHKIVYRWAAMLTMTVALTAAMVGAGPAGAQGNDDGFRLPPLTTAGEAECDHGPKPTPEPQPTPEVCEHPKPTPPVAPTPEPTPQPTTEPTVEPTPQPTVEPIPEPTAEPTPQPTTEPSVEPTILPAQPTPTETPAVPPADGGAGPAGGQADELARTGPSLSVGLVLVGLTTAAAGAMVLATRRRFDPR